MTSFQREINWSALGKTSQIPARTQQHLVQVYTTLAGSLLFAALGTIFYLFFHVHRYIPIFASFASLFWLFMTPKEQVGTRVGILGLFSFLTGMHIGPLIDLIIDIDPAIITSAFLGTVCIFVCFSASAYFASRRSYLFLGGFISSALTTLIFLNFLNIFFGSLILFNISLYGGLLLFCAYIMFDTQLIIEKASSGTYDVVTDSLELFLDFINIFVRLLIILAKDKKNKK